LLQSYQLSLHLELSENPSFTGQRSWAWRSSDAPVDGRADPAQADDMTGDLPAARETRPTTAPHDAEGDPPGVRGKIEIS
jgi:hypothetical protein